MQRAARKVAEDNARLRSLLGACGVSQEEVDAYLRSFDTAASSPGVCSVSVGEIVARCQSRVLDRASDREQGSSIHLAGAFKTSNEQVHVQPQRQDSNSHQAPHTRPLNSASPVQLRPSCSKPLEHNRSTTTAPCQPVYPSSSTTESIDCPDTEDCFCPPALPPSEPQHYDDPSLAISCEAAATIIAEMRGDGDTEAIRAKLGCAGRAQCSVKNSTVLQIMDEG